MKNYLTKRNLDGSPWRLGFGNSVRSDLVAGTVRNSQLKKISSLKKSQMLTKYNKLACG